MNVSYINTMAANLVACYWNASKVRLSAPAIRDNIPEIVKLANKGANDASPIIREAAQKLLVILKAEGIDVAAPVSSQPAAVSAPTAAPKPAAPLDKTVSSEWISFERIAIDEAGPMGGRLVQRVREENPGLSPKALRGKLEAKLGGSMVGDIFAKYRGN